MISLLLWLCALCLSVFNVSINPGPNEWCVVAVCSGMFIILAVERIRDAIQEAKKAICREIRNSNKNQ